MLKLGYDDLGQHYHRTGDLMNSAKAYQKMRDFCTMPSHIVVMYLRIINVSIDQGTWLGVQSSIQKIRSIGQKESQVEKIAAKLSAALGLSYLCTGNYREAAETFLDTDPSMVSARMDDPTDEEAYNEVLTPNDIAVYGGLASLASMDRDELQKRVLENFSFRTYLELEPHIRRAISSFVSGKYSSCLSILDTYRPDYLLDLHLQKHVGELYNQIRSKAIQQFFIPYSHVTFVDFAAAFNTDVTTIEKEVIRMIQAKTLEARIDLVNKVVMAYRIDPRRKAFEDAMKMAKFFNKALYLRHIHMVMVNAGMEVKAPKGQTSLASLEAQTSFHANTLDALLENTGRGGRTTRSGGRFP